ncbi:MAG: glycosyltransferase family 4 protein [Planctomycetes bacterium]|nr:glycosyltransferase family 4 protein [Planctomycetota bacterium]
MREELTVAVDVRAIADPPTGIAVYVREVLRALAAAEPAWRLEVFHGPARAAAPLLVELAARPRTHLHPVRSDPRQHPRADLWEQVALPRALRRAGADIFIAPAYHMPLGPLRPRRLFVIYDLVAFRFPETLRKRFALYLRFLIRAGVRAADRVVAISEAVRGEIARRFRIAADRIRVIPPGAEHRPAPSAEEVAATLDRLGLAPGFILCAGTLETRKNIPSLVRAHARMGADAPPLVLAGAPGPDRAAVEEAARAGAGRVHILGHAADADLEGLYRAAGALALPSIYEGFGIPLLEAMRAGLPAVASDIPVFREVAGDAALYAAPGDEAAWAEAIGRALRDARLRAALARRGSERALRFTWKGAGGALAALCRDAAGDRA